MSTSNLFGPIVTGEDVERAVADFLWKPDDDGLRWLDGYIGELERHSGYEPGQVQRPLGVVTRSELDTWPEDQTPVIVVVAGGLARRPVVRGGKYEATWALAIAPVVSDIDEAGTRRLAHVYAGAVRLSMVQHGTLDGFAESTEWLDENLTAISFPDTRSIQAGQVVFEVTVAGVARRDAGPTTRLPDPSVDPGPWPDITARNVEVEQVSITEDVHA